MIIRESVKVIVPRFFPDLKFLAVTNRKFGKFTAPAGKTEAEEIALLAAQRELKEETGIEVFVQSLILLANVVHQGYLNKDEMWNCNTYLAFTNQEPKQIEEGTLPFWTTYEEFKTNSLFPQFYKDIEDRVFKTIASNVFRLPPEYGLHKNNNILLDGIISFCKNLGFKVEEIYSGISVSYNNIHIATLFLNENKLITNQTIFIAPGISSTTFDTSNPTFLQELKSFLDFRKQVYDKFPKTV